MNTKAKSLEVNRKHNAMEHVTPSPDTIQAKQGLRGRSWASQVAQLKPALSPWANAGLIQAKAGEGGRAGAASHAGKGEGLPDALKAGVEGLSGLDMSDVNVHRNSEKPAQMGALAYAQGTDIHLGPGQEKHLPHEAWHVVQQKQGRVAPTRQMKGDAINDDAGLEREADVMGEKAATYTQQPAKVEGEAGPVGLKGSEAIQCILDDDAELMALDLTAIANCVVLRVVEGVGVWQITVGGADYILKSAEEAMGETITTRMAGLLGVRVPRICTRTLTEAEAAALGDVDTAWHDEEEDDEDVEFEAGDQLLLMDRVAGGPLDGGLDNEDPLELPADMDRATFLQEMGQLAAVDVVLGIGDRFNIEEATCENVNFGNIMVGPVGEDAHGLTGIDYDVDQGLWSGGGEQEIVDRHAAYVAYATNTFANDLDAIVTLVREALTDSGFEVVDGDNALIMAGVALVQTRINALSVDELNAIRDRGDAHLAGYGTHVRGIVNMVRAGAVAVVDDADDAEVAEDGGDE